VSDDTTNATLIKAAIALIPTGLLVAWSVASFIRGKTLGRLLHLLGAGCLVVVVLTHLAEALHIFALMHWGEEQSAGHYLDLWSAILGIALLPLGYLLHALGKRASS